MRNWEGWAIQNWESGEIHNLEKLRNNRNCELWEIENFWEIENCEKLKVVRNWKPWEIESREKLRTKKLGMWESVNRENWN